MPMPPADRSHRRLPALLALLAGVLGAMVLAPALAAQPPCAPRYPGPETSAAMFDMTQLTLDTLDALPEVDVVIVARGGQDLSRYGLHHSHLAFLARNPQGRWEVLHLLNRCRSDHSDLYREGLVNLVGESALRSDLRIGIPVPALRAQLQRLLAAPASQARALHQPRYSMLAYPGSGAYQNSNQWVLEVLAAAMAQAEGAPAIVKREQAQQWLRQQKYQPSVLHIGLGKRVGARLFVANATTTDHPAGERISGNYSVVTVESVFDFLHRRQLLQRELSIPAQAAPVPDATR